MKLTPIVTVIVGLIAFAGCNSEADDSSKATAKPASYVADKSRAVDEHLLIGPQPIPGDFEDLKAGGIQRVVNFRTPAEMKKLPFREQQILADLGIDYVEIPVGGDQFAYSPAQLEALSDVLRNDDKTLLHCASGHRASVIAVAYLIKERGMPVDEALQHAKSWWPLALQDVLGQELSLSIKAPPQ